MEAPPGELIVGRAWNWTADVLRRQAETDMLDQEAAGVASPRPTISVFALTRLPDEELEQTIVRLERHIQTFRSTRWLAVTTRSELRDRGFELELHEPPPDHYDVVLGEIMSEDAIVALEEAFNQRERRRVAS